MKRFIVVRYTKHFNKQTLIVLLLFKFKVLKTFLLEIKFTNKLKLVISGYIFNKCLWVYDLE